MHYFLNPVQWLLGLFPVGGGGGGQSGRGEVLTTHPTASIYNVVTPVLRRCVCMVCSRVKFNFTMS
jgi:hypothetical protein